MGKLHYCTAFVVVYLTGHGMLWLPVPLQPSFRCSTNELIHAMVGVYTCTAFADIAGNWVSQNCTVAAAYILCRVYVCVCVNDSSIPRYRAPDMTTLRFPSPYVNFLISALWERCRGDTHPPLVMVGGLKFLSTFSCAAPVGRWDEGCLVPIVLTGVKCFACNA